jgi:hypothetical protein
LAEGTETVVLFSVMTLFPDWFPVLAYGFAALCVLTVFQRSALAVMQFKD